ncbi:fimbrial protein [Cupriavidus pauculus]|uniref:Fimbrial protein n=1 Tax=Cupriavidus pauculus TaxID=82633 RepID=A0A2N5CE20_9BURK|nr:fimbrial protein [Cupriavidus pauculus]PLQ00448.1 fimbrial protein [Cupriavidus pauculus]
MEKKRMSAIISAGAFVIASGVWASEVWASDGTITFTGEITAQTCTVNSTGGGNNFTVVLPTVAASTLGTSGATTGDTAFSILLSRCTPDSGPVRTHFEAGSTVNADGRLLQQTGTATNVEIQLLNGDQSVIKVGDSVASQNSNPTTIASGSATLPYFGRYYATASATAGTVNTYVTYSMAYE